MNTLRLMREAEAHKPKINADELEALLIAWCLHRRFQFRIDAHWEPARGKVFEICIENGMLSETVEIADSEVTASKSLPMLIQEKFS